MYKVRDFILLKELHTDTDYRLPKMIMIITYIAYNLDVVTFSILGKESIQMGQMCKLSYLAEIPQIHLGNDLNIESIRMLYL